MSASILMNILKITCEAYHQLPRLLEAETSELAAAE